LDTRTKRTIAKDRLLVAEQRILDVERRKSASNLQSLAYEQKQIEKKLSSLHTLDQSLHSRHRSTSEANIHRTTSWHGSSQINSSKSSNQNLLSLPKVGKSHRTYSNEDFLDNPIFTSDTESDDEYNSKQRQPPTVAIIPPEEDHFYLTK
jgi:hypothetical protein